MIWLTWRQSRPQAWSVLTLLAAFGLALAVTAPGLRHLYRSSGAAGCTADCDRLGSAFLAAAKAGEVGGVYRIGFAVLTVVPVIIGVFWGAPLAAREFEAGTHRLVWNQSVTRGRWLTVKLLGGGLAGAAWLDAQHLTQFTEYQPSSRFWALQWIETGLFLVMSALLAAVCFWWVTRRH